MGAEQPIKTTLGVVFVQHDRGKYPGALTRLIRSLDAIERIETRFLVVDNALPGDWEHAVNRRIFHLGGDNRAWEFSAFDRGIEWFERQTVPPDLYLLATDALLAYGEQFLGLVDHRMFDLALERKACVGWMDSFMAPCQILDETYTTWIRTSLLLMPRSVLPVATPLAWPLDDNAIFGVTAAQPFQPDAPLSDNLQRLLLEWLTSNPDDESHLDEVWHSQFHLDDTTLALFCNKAKSILREHLLSARLLRSDVPCFDLRSLPAARAEGLTLKDLRGDEGYHWQWLRWHDTSLAESPPERAPAPMVDPTAPPTVVLHFTRHLAECRSVAAFLSRDVLPLIQQRHAGARFLASGAVPKPGHTGEHALATVSQEQEALKPGDLGIVGLIIVGDDHDTDHHTFHRFLLAHGIPLLASGLIVHPDAGPSAVGGSTSSWSLAAACCRAIDAVER